MPNVTNPAQPRLTLTPIQAPGQPTSHGGEIPLSQRLGFPSSVTLGNPERKEAAELRVTGGVCGQVELRDVLEEDLGQVRGTLMGKVWRPLRLEVGGLGVELEGVLTWPHLIPTQD